MHLDLGFHVFGIFFFWGFCGFVKNFGLGFVKMNSYDYALCSKFIITLFHAFSDCVADYIL